MTKVNDDKRTISETSLVEKDGKDPEKGGEGKGGGGYPKSIFFIIGNEFCERFSYYGMRTILTLYLNEFLKYSKDDSTMIYHIFSMLCYFTPLIGAIISDSFLGKFKTIFYISIVYVAGNIVLSVSAIPGYGFHQVIAMLGLLFIAFGTGGIKPCVAAFGGDQFRPDQDKQLERFFSIFYISINAGSLISTYLTPVLREDVQCWGGDCYALAFGVPAGLMIIALMLFLFGKPLYKMNPPTGNVVVQVTSCIVYALKNKKKGAQKRDHWLDNADDKYDKSLIEDIKCLLHVLVLYLPLPIFWALFDQQGSRWLIQATQMDGHITENIRIKPDQVQVVNPLLIVACIPLFQFVIYPVFNKMNLLKSSLQKMTVGGMLAAASFVVAFFVELALEKTLPVLPVDGHGQINLINNLPCQLRVELQRAEPFFVEPGQVYQQKDLQTGDLTYLLSAERCSVPLKNATYSHNLDNLAIDSLFIYQENQEISVLQTPDTLAKPQNAETHVRIFYNLPEPLDENATIVLELDEEHKYSLETDSQGGAGFTNYTLVPPAVFRVLLPHQKEPIATIETKSGGGYILQIKPDKNYTFTTIVEPNTLSLMVQIPQYVVLTFGEIMFSITGLEFSYSQAPASMKSVLQGGWLMTVAFGNLIVAIVAKAGHMKQSYEFIMFACLMFVDMIIFAIMAYFYKSMIRPRDDSEAEPLPEKKGSLALNNSVSKNGKQNEGYVNDANSKM